MVEKVSAGGSSDIENVQGLQFFDVREISVAQWHPIRDGKGKPLQVHMRVVLNQFPHPIILRFRSSKPLDSLIAQLQLHRREVWGDPGVTAS